MISTEQYNEIKRQQSILTDRVAQIEREQGEYQQRILDLEADKACALECAGLYSVQLADAVAEYEAYHEV